MNFHTHTTYCDGKETAEQMVQAAIAKGFTRLGFSGHGFNDFRPEDQEVWCMRQRMCRNIRRRCAPFGKV